MENYKTSKIYDIIEYLETEPSMNEKQMILKDNIDNEWWKKLLLYTYNPYWNYYLLEIPQDIYDLAGTEIDQNRIESNEYNNTFFALLDSFRTRTVTGHAQKQAIRDYIVNVEQETAYILDLVLQRDLGIGVQATTINKVYKDLIPTYNIQKATDAAYELPMYGEVKYDGARVTAIVLENDVTFFSSNGKPMKFKNLTDELLFIDNGRMLTYDGEITLLGNDTQSTRKVSGDITRYIRGTADEDLDLTFQFNVFDVIPSSVFTVMGETDEIEDRIALRNSLFEEVFGGTDHIREVTTIYLETEDEVNEWYTDIVENYGEGLILKEPGSRYSYTRDLNWIKIKETKECELRVVGYQPGAGKYIGGIGALLCQSECGELRVEVGSGLSDTQRGLEPVDIKDSSKGLKPIKGFDLNQYNNTIVTCRYNTLVDDKDGNLSLFIPRFPKASSGIYFIRDDKDMANTLEEIKDITYYSNKAKEKRK